MSELLPEVLDAHGGAARWSGLQTLEATVVSDGAFWGSVGLVGDPRPSRVLVWLHHQRVVVWRGGLRADFTPDRLTIGREDGAVVSEVLDPHDRFALRRAVPWDLLHRAYFDAVSFWTYLTLPFLLARPDIEVAEQEPWREDEETWRVLRARFPRSIQTLGEVQDFFFGADRLLRRHDVHLGVAGDFHWAVMICGYLEADGVKTPARRQAYRRGPDRRPILKTLMSAIDVSDLRVSRSPTTEVQP